MQREGHAESPIEPIAKRSEGWPAPGGARVELEFHVASEPTSFGHVTAHSHHLRYTAASLMRAGAMLHELATILGYTTTRLTEDLYGHIYKAAKREIASRMDQALAPASNPVPPQALPERIM